MQLNEFISLFNQMVETAPADILAGMVNRMNINLASDLTDNFADKTTVERLKEAAMGDMVLEVSLAEDPLTSGTFTSGFDHLYKVRLLNANGDVHTWFNKNVTSILSVSDTGDDFTAELSGNGDAALFINGVASIVAGISGTEIAVSDTITVGIGSITIMGTTVSGDDFVETIPSPGA